MLSVGAGWDVGRHLFPAPAWRLTAVDVDLNVVTHATETGQADEALVARAGELPFEPGSFDVVLYRLVLHHVAYTQPLGPVIAEAARLLRPGGALVAVEPGLFHPVGAALALANRVGCGEADPRHGRRPAAFAAEAAQLTRARRGSSRRSTRSRSRGAGSRVRSSAPSILSMDSAPSRS